MPIRRAHCVILAGPNGAGKTTAAPSLLRDLLGLTNFVNADVIAQGLSGFEPERAAIEAGRVVPSPEHAIARVRRRVSRGGHSVDPEIVRRRYSRGLRNFFEIYRDLADEWHFVNNSQSSGPQPIAFQPVGDTIHIVDAAIWNQVVERYGDRSNEQ